MKCNHCGFCCNDPCTQVNLTVGDIHRIASFLKVPIEKLFPEYMDINPFGDPDLIHYDLDLGLNNPCKFRVNNRCSIYPARPLNCRLFPYWILAEAPPEKLNDILEDYGFDYDMLRKKDYQKYKEEVGEVLLKESKWLELNKKVNVTRIKGFNDIIEPDFRKKEQAKINLIKNWNKDSAPLEKIKELINEHKDTIEENLETVKKAEKIVK